jgi:DNA-binding transcriptional LysR family regulator
MIKRSHIRQFLAIVEAGSFTQAAARIRVTQPTLSSGIAELERLVGTQLFVRDRKRVRMTESGARLLPIARDLEMKFLAADNLAQATRAPWPALKLGLLRSLSGTMMQELVARVPEGIGLELVDGNDAELRKALASGRADVIATLLRPGDAGTNAAAMLTEPYMLFVSAAHRLAGSDRVAPEDLAGEVMIARRSCEVLAETSRFFTQRGVRPRFSLRSESEDRCMRMVAANRGITTAPLSLRSEGTVPVTLDGYAFERTIGLVADSEWLAIPAHGEAFAALAAVVS